MKSLPGLGREAEKGLWECLVAAELRVHRRRDGAKADAQNAAQLPHRPLMVLFQLAISTSGGRPTACWRIVAGRSGRWFMPANRSGLTLRNFPGPLGAGRYPP